MALYQYTALSKEGRRKMGMINADSIELAKERLRKDEILVTKLVSYTKKGKSLGFRRLFSLVLQEISMSS